MASPRKKTEIALKANVKSNLPLYFDRFREIEIYLRLLQEPRLVGSLLQTVPVGATAAVERIEQELKSFIEHRFQVLTGLVQEADTDLLAKEELLALKLLASKVMPKVQQPEPAKENPLEYKNSALQKNYESEPEVHSESVQTQTESLDDDLVDVQVVSGDEKLKKRRKEQEDLKNVVKETEVPIVKEPTDRMKRSRPKGTAPKPKASPQEEMAMAAMQAQQSSAAFSQMTDGRVVMAPTMSQPSNDLVLDDTFTMYR